MNGHRAVLTAAIVIFTLPVLAQANPIQIELIGPSGPVAVGGEFQVDVEVTSQDALVMVQATIDSLDPSMELIDVSSSLTSVVLITSPVTGSPNYMATMDFFPDAYPSPAPGTFIAGTLTFSAATAGTFPLDLFIEDGSSYSTAAFDPFYNPRWDVDVQGTSVTVVESGSTVSIEATDPIAAEPGTDTGTFTITRTGGNHDLDLYVHVAANPYQTDALASEYLLTDSMDEPLGDVVIIPSGQPSTTITLTPVDDSVIEEDEVVGISLLPHPTAAAAYAVGAPSEATVTIQSDDLMEVTVEAIDPAAAEEAADQGVFRISRLATDASAPLTVYYQIGGTARNGADYATLLESVDIPAGETYVDVVVDPVDDYLIEGGGETVTITILDDPEPIMSQPGLLLLSEWFNSTDWTGVPSASYEMTGPIAWSYASYPPETGWIWDHNNFSVRYSGRVYASEDGVYQFRERSDDYAWLDIDGLPVIEEDWVWTSNGIGSVFLARGWHSIEFRFREVGGADWVYLDR